MIIRVAKFRTCWTRACSRARSGTIGQHAVLIEVQLGVIVSGRERQQGVVQEVESRSTQLQVLVFREGELLEQREIAVPELGRGDVRES